MYFFQRACLALGLLWVVGVLPGTGLLAKGTKGPVAAIVNGETLYLDTLNSRDIAETRRKLYQLEKRRLQQVVLEQLRRTKPKEFSSPKIEVKEKDLLRVYNESDLSRRGSLETFRDRIRNYLITEKTEQMEDMLFKKAMRLGYVTPRLSPPPPYLYRIERVNRKNATMGPQNAEVSVVEFSDFQ